MNVRDTEKALMKCRPRPELRSAIGKVSRGYVDSVATGHHTLWVTSPEADHDQAINTGTRTGP